MMRRPLVSPIGIFIFLLAGFLLSSCKKHEGIVPQLTQADTLRILQEIARYRADADEFFRNSPDSPFRRDTTIRFTGIKWLPPNLNYYFQSTLHRYDHPETVIILGTKGEERKELKYGYFVFIFGGAEYKLNVYKSAEGNASRALSVWFTDATTGKETYHVGRYVDVGDESPDQSHIYTVNLNNAYNPYCAYSAMYSCAVPRKEDHLPFAVHAGEMNYDH